MYADMLRSRHRHDVVNGRLIAMIIDLSRCKTTDSKSRFSEWISDVSVAFSVAPPCEAAEVAVF
jgi:hypothetical protein